MPAMVRSGSRLPGRKKQYRELYKGLHLVFINKFEEADVYFARCANSEVGRSLPPYLRASHILLNGFTKLLRAISSWGKDAIDKALEMMWEAEALAATDTKHKLGAKLVQAHAYLQGAFLQILQKRLVKAAWNIRSSWKCFQCALDQLKTYDGPAEMRAEHETSTKLGIGSFNLILSLMPPLVIAVTKVLGFSADRQLGLKYLREAYKHNALMSPIAGLVLLLYLTTTSSMLAEQTEEYRKEAGNMIQTMLKMHPNGLFILWTKTSLLRSQRKHEEAIKVARIADKVCKDAPALAMMSEWQSGWCNMLLLRWHECKLCFLTILKSEHKATEDGVPGFYCYVAGLSAINSGEYDEGYELLVRVKKEAKNHDIPHEQYAVRKADKILKILDREKKKTDDKKGITEIYLSTAYIEQIELLLEWNFIKYIPDDLKIELKQKMTNWHSKRAELNWTDTHMGYYHLLMSHLSFLENDIEAALNHGVTAVGYAKRARPAHSTLMPQCYFFVSTIYLNQNPPDFERATKKCNRAKDKCTGDLGKRMMFLIHSLKSRIARLKKEYEENSNAQKEIKDKDADDNNAADNDSQQTQQGGLVSNAPRISGGGEAESGDGEKNRESGGYLADTVGLVRQSVGGAMSWGWGAITGEESNSDDAVEDQKLERLSQERIEI